MSTCAFITGTVDGLPYSNGSQRTHCGMPAVAVSTYCPLTAPWTQEHCAHHAELENARYGTVVVAL